MGEAFGGALDDDSLDISDTQSEDADGTEPVTQLGEGEAQIVAYNERRAKKIALARQKKIDDKAKDSLVAAAVERRSKQLAEDISHLDSPPTASSVPFVGPPRRKLKKSEVTPPGVLRQSPRVLAMIRPTPSPPIRRPAPRATAPAETAANVRKSPRKVRNVVLPVKKAAAAAKKLVSKGKEAAVEPKQRDVDRKSVV